MRFLDTENITTHIVNALRTIAYISIPVTMFALFYLGTVYGYREGWNHAVVEYNDLINKSERVSSREVVIRITPTPQQRESTPTQQPRRSVYLDVDWGGPELWTAVNERRVSNGVNPLDTRSELCTIASIRLNELLDLGKLDAHQGFSDMTERRPDLEWIFEKYSNVTEFLAYGGETASETVDLWENTLGHSKLIKGGEYVWGCVYAQNSFAVAITAY